MVADRPQAVIDVVEVTAEKLPANSRPASSQGARDNH